jgi:hypothetical protein
MVYGASINRQPKTTNNEHAGADGETRTLNLVKGQASETCAYTNSATSA